MHSSTRRKIMGSIDLSTSPIPWWEWDVHNNDVLFNDLKVSVLGYNPADFRGRGYEAFTRIVHPEDHDRVMQAMYMLLTGERDLYETDYRIMDITGKYHWYMDRGFATEANGHDILRVRGLVIDLGREVREGADLEGVLTLLRKASQDHDSVLSLCATCRRVKTTSDAWTPVTPEFQIVLADKLSHGICEDCVRKLYPEIAEKIFAEMRLQNTTSRPQEIRSCNNGS